MRFLRYKVLKSVMGPGRGANTQILALITKELAPLARNYFAIFF